MATFFAIIMLLTCRIIYLSLWLLMCSTGREVEKKIEQWRRAMEDSGLKIKVERKLYLKSSADENLAGNSDINLQGEFGKGDCIYLGSTLAEDGHLYVEITHKVQSRWKNYEST